MPLDIVDKGSKHVEIVIKHVRINHDKVRYFRRAGGVCDLRDDESKSTSHVQGGATVGYSTHVRLLCSSGDNGPRGHIHIHVYVHLHLRERWCGISHIDAQELIGATSPTSIELMSRGRRCEICHAIGQYGYQYLDAPVHR